jgi:hypothetical protein
MRGQEAARRLAGRLNYLPIAAFGLWSVPAKLFWLVALGLVPWFEAGPGWRAALPWCLLAFATGPLILLAPGGFHVPRRWEYRGRVYRAAGVELFRAIVANGDLVNRFVRARTGGGYSVYGADFDKLIPKSIWNEQRHWAYLSWGFVTAFYAHHLGWDGWAAWLSVANVGANLYPIMLQRYSRARVMRLVKVSRRRPGAPEPA